MENTQKPLAEWAFRSQKRLRKKGMSSEKGALCHVFPDEILELHFSPKVYRWLQVANDHKTVAEVALSN
jgi:hypothetical protein